MDEIKTEAPNLLTSDAKSLVDLAVAVDNFNKELPRRSFSGRNPELGKMIKCAMCLLRHREHDCHIKEQKFADRPGTPEGEHDPMMAEPKRHTVAVNPYWRRRPGVMRWIPEIKKFVRITQ